MTRRETPDADPKPRRDHPEEDAGLGDALPGRPEAFERLVRLHMRDVYALAYRLTGRHADADDLAQETFLRAWKSLPAFRAESRFGTWLYRIAVNAFLNRKKALERRTRLEEEARDRPPTRVPEDPSGRAERDEIRRRLRLEVDRLPPRQRTAFVLHTYQGLDYETIASVMETTRDNVKVNLSLARKKLRKRMGDLL